jgi:hypothetical protein
MWVFRGGTGNPTFNEIRPAVAKPAPLTDDGDDDGRRAT